MPHFSHIDDIDFESPIAIDHNRSLLAITKEAEHTQEPIILVVEGKPVAAIISLEALSNLYGELRCLRLLQDIATTSSFGSLRTA